MTVTVNTRHVYDERRDWGHGENERIFKVDVRCLTILATVSLIAGCASNSSDGGSTGRVNGSALAGPTCPVEQPGDPNCQPKPVQGTVQFAQGDHVVISVRINADGSFAAEVPAGTYTVTVDIGDNIFPVCESVEVEVLANADTVVELACDTGIR